MLHANILEMFHLQVMADVNGELATGDLIHYVKSSNLSKAFDSADQDSDHQWKKKVRYGIPSTIYHSHTNRREFTAFTLSDYSP